MRAIMPSKLIEMSQASDPVKAVWDAIGTAVDGVKVFNNQLLVATYIAPEMSAGGIILGGDRSRMENLYQGCLGVVLKLGKTAFMSDDTHDWLEQSAKVGDWVMFRFSAGWEQHLNGVSVRFVDDVDIKAVIDDPALVTSRAIKAAGA